MNEGTEFMIGIENQTSWIERYSVDVYGMLTLVGFVLYIIVKKTRLVCKKKTTKKEKTK